MDVWRAVTLPLLRKVIGADGQLQLKIARRGAPPKVWSGNAFTCGPGSQQTDESILMTIGNAGHAASRLRGLPHANWTVGQDTESTSCICRAAGSCS